MKKLLVTLLACSSIAYAADDCSKVAQKVVDKLAAKNKTEFSINYSADKADWAQTCKTAILAKNPNLNVKMNQVEGSGKFKFSK